MIFRWQLHRCLGLIRKKLSQTLLFFHWEKTDTFYLILFHQASMLQFLCFFQIGRGILRRIILNNWIFNTILQVISFDVRWYVKHFFNFFWRVVFLHLLLIAFIHWAIPKWVGYRFYCYSCLIFLYL